MQYILMLSGLGLQHINLGNGEIIQLITHSYYGFPECCCMRWKNHLHLVAISLIINLIDFPSLLCHSCCPSLLLLGIEILNKSYPIRLWLKLCFLGGQAETTFKPEVVIFRRYLLTTMNHEKKDTVHVSTFSHLISFSNFDYHIVIFITFNNIFIYL